MTIGTHIAPSQRQYKIFRQVVLVRQHWEGGAKQERTESRKLEGRKDLAVRGRAV